ncbi:MAG: ATP synthase F0 subunit B, partial [Candidatus Omnitrophica bacterium]|nr:ATP synthase F0 subunit B [Candidatus Omnitrophota bacterium]
MLIFVLIVLELLVFFVLVFIFRKVMTKNVVEATRHLEELNQQYQKREEELNLKYQEFEAKSEEIIEKAQAEAQKIKQQLLSEGEEQKEKIIQQARQQAEQIIQQADKSRQVLLLELEERIEKSAIDKACQLIQQTLPEDFRRGVHQHWVEELINQGFINIENLHIPEDIREVEVATPFSLSEEEKKSLREKIRNIFGR